MTIAVFAILFSLPSRSQNCIPTNINNTTITLACNQTCRDIRFSIPHIKSTSDYSVATIPYNPYPYVTATGTEDVAIYNDDKYSNLFSLPFNFCFYDSIFNKVSIGSNGIVTFDYNLATCPGIGAAWSIGNTIPFNSGLPTCNANAGNYPKAAIMAAFSDLDPRPGPASTTNSSPPDRKIEWRVEGVAPCRVFIASYYHIGVFQSQPCGIDPLTAATFQIVLHESTGLIDIFVQNKQCDAISANGTRAIMGVQNWNRDKAVAAPGKNATSWTSSNEGYQFIPSGGGSRYMGSRLFTMAGVLVAVADTSTVTPGLLDLNFPNVCFPAGSTQYKVVTTFSACDDPLNLLVTTDTITVNRTNSLLATATATNTTCGPPSGSITVNIPAGVGTAPYTAVMDGTVTLTGPGPITFNNVSQGIHNLVVTDASAGCSSIIRISVGITNNLAATLTAASTSCAGASNGSLTMTPTNGVGPYMFTLNPGNVVQTGATSATFTNLAAGTYSITFTDGSGCTLAPAYTGTVTAGAGLSASLGSLPTSCAGATNGSLTVTPTSGTGPYTFTLNPGNIVQTGATATTFTNLGAGIYNVNITDASGCIATPALAASVTAGAGITSAITSAATSCAGVSNGTITVTPSSGVGPYTFTLSPGAVVQTGATGTTYTNLAVGNYTVTVRDNNNCTTSSPLTIAITAGPGLTGTTAAVATACPGINNGNVSVTATSGTGPYTFTLNPGNIVQTGPLGTTFTNLAAGNYTVAIMDNNNCITNTPLAATITTGPGLVATINAAPTACAGANNGRVNVTPTNGTGPYTFLLNPGAVSQTGATTIFNNLAPGTYTVTVTDANGCVNISALTATVNAGAGISANVFQTIPSCTGVANGTITVTPSNGTAPYTFVLDGALTQTGATTMFNNLPSGAHSVMITDAIGCVTTAPINITIGAGPVFMTTATHTNVLCNGGSTGTITIVPPAGPGPFEYSLDNISWQTSNLFSGLSAATYTYYFRESITGCQGQFTEIVAQPALLDPIVDRISNVICNGQSNGMIFMTTLGGVAPFEYSLNGGTTWQSSNILTVAAGLHTVTVRDANQCIATKMVTISEPPALNANATTANATCNGGNDGRITVTATGGNTGYQYSADGTTFQASNILNVAPGTYTVTVKDNLGCVFTIPNQVVGLTNDLTFTAPVAPTICEGKSTQLQIVSNALQYAWTPSTGLSNAAIANPTANPTATTNYMVRVTYGRCFADVPLTVNVNAAPVPNAGGDGFICYGQDYQLQASGGTSFTWTPSTYLDNASVNNPLSTPDKTITYSLSVSDGNGCNSLVTDQVTVDVTPPIHVNTYPYDTVAYSGDQIQLLATSVATDYVWTPSTGLNNPAIANPIVTAGAVGDVVLYKVIASTQAGCKGEGFVKVRVYKGPELYVPTGFTPNGDGKNDRFFPFPVGVKEIKYFRVFNRWGEMMFSTSRLNDGWDGKFGGIEQASGVYVWMVEGITKENKVVTKRGTVMLIR
jgi:gliding motility-associated-like protein